MTLSFAINVLLILSTLQLLPCMATYCWHNNVDDYKCRLTSRTPYRFIANYDDSPLEYEGCTAQKIWLIVRHGARYPGKKYISSLLGQLPQLKNAILNNYHMNKTYLTAEDARLIAQWKPSFNASDIMKLTEEGECELLDLGERYQARFPSLFPETYDNQTYKFKYTNTQRTRESARNFVAGLFGWHNSQRVLYPQAEDKDPILRFYKRCPRWQETIHDNPAAQKEKHEFLKTDAALKAIAEISEHIGLQVNYTTARLIHIMCGFETAWNRAAESPWCRLLSLDQFKVFEFADDLEYYWVDGYGYHITYEQACAALIDVFRFFTSDNQPKVTAYFSHSGAVLKILAVLGAVKDEPMLTHDMFVTHGDNRKWKIGLIDAFASNVAFVLYNCASGGPSILFMHQERPLYLPGCPANAPCPISTMEALYPDKEEECPFEAMCRLPK